MDQSAEVFEVLRVGRKSGVSIREFGWGHFFTCDPSWPSRSWINRKLSTSSFQFSSRAL